MVKENKVSLWLGFYENADNFKNYIKVSYDDDGNYIPSSFQENYAIKRYDQDKGYLLISLFLFFATNLYIESMNLVRQYVAMSFTFLAFTYRLDKSFLKYILLMSLAISMHSSAVICLVVYE